MRRAFSLVELLVVVAIFAALAALMLPAFVRARGAADRSRCAQEMRQIGVALSLYVMDGCPPRRISSHMDLDRDLGPYTGGGAARLMGRWSNHQKLYYLHPPVEQGTPTHIGAFDMRHRGRPMFGFDVPLYGGAPTPWTGKPPL